MMKTKLWLALPAIVSAIACAQPASAEVVSYTYTGHIDTGADQIGLFGNAGGNLGGLGFTAVFYRDDDLADPADIFLGDANSYVRGSDAVKAKLTIGGVTIDVGGVAGEQNQYDDGAFEGFSHYAAGALGGFSLVAHTLGTFGPADFDYLASPDYHSLPSLTPEATPGFAWSGAFNFGAADPTNENRGLFTTGRFVPTALVVSPPPGGGAVPEPATWAMMIAGFGGVGWTLRRRRGMAAFA